MSCFGCFGVPKETQTDVVKETRETQQQKVAPQQAAPQHQAQPSNGGSTAVITVPCTRAVMTDASLTVVEAQPIVCLPPAPPWRSREELADIALRVADASGAWLERTSISAAVLADSLGASLVSIWSFSSDKSTAVVLASGGLLRRRQPPGLAVAVQAPPSPLAAPAPAAEAAQAPHPQLHAQPLQHLTAEAALLPRGASGQASVASVTGSAGVTAAGGGGTGAVAAAGMGFALEQVVSGEGETSLQRIVARQAAFAWSAEGNPGPLGTHPATTTIAASGARGRTPPPTSPPDLQQLAAATGVQHCAVVPLKYGGSLVGALQICLGGAVSLLPLGVSFGGGGGGGGGGGTAGLGCNADRPQLVDLIFGTVPPGGGGVSAPNSANRLTPPPGASVPAPAAPRSQANLGRDTAGTVHTHNYDDYGGVGGSGGGGGGPYRAPRSGLSHSRTASATAAAAKPVPNWLPHHLPELMLLSPPAAAAACGGGAAATFGIGVGMTSTSAHVAAAAGDRPVGSVTATGAAAVKSVPQVVVDLVSVLRRCDTIAKLISALITGLQDLTYRVTAMQFTATPMLLHRSGTTAAIFQDCTAGGTGGAGASGAATAAAAAAGGGGGGGGGGSTRGEGDCDSRPWTGGPPSSTQSSPPQFQGDVALEAAGLCRPVKAHVTHLHHTLMLQLISGPDHAAGSGSTGRYRRQYGGAIIQNCSEYMQDESSRGRDVSLCHRVGVSDTGSLLLAAGLTVAVPLPSGLEALGRPSGGGGAAPLLAAYATSREPLPEPLLEAALAVVATAIKLSLTTLQSLLSPGGELAEEWATLHDTHLNPASVGLSTSCTPRSLLRSAIKDVPAPPSSSQPQAQLGAGAGGASGLLTSVVMQHAHSLPSVGAVPSGLIAAAANDDGITPTAYSTTSVRRSLSFGIAVHSAAAPRSNLGLMVSSIRSSLNQVLSQRAALEAEGLQDDVNGVELLKQIGQGGQGVVFCGTLHGLEVAIKVVGTEEGADEVYDIDDEGAMIKLKRVLKRDATELAVTTSISHPNIVQVFSYFVDVMVVEYVGQPDRFRLLPKAKGAAAAAPGGGWCGSGVGGENGGGGGGGGVTGPSNMIICMEYCDAGSLKHAVKRGCFRVEGGRPNMLALYTTLMEIALALRHLHALRLVHCDLKPSNILLKSSMRDPRGWVCKLSDFGCVRLMSEPAPGCRPAFNLEYAVGTPSFMAPEMFCKGHPLDTAVDIYSFGILMWEVYTGQSVYEGVPPDKLPYHVVKRGLRPSFPPDVPSTYRSLAQACWASDPRSRPAAAALVTVLQRLLSASAAAAAAAAAGPGLVPGRG